MDSGTLDCALGVACAGFRVCFTHSIGSDGRCTCGRSTCPERSWGKHPIERAWQKIATDDPDVLRSQYDRVRHVVNISVVLGEQSSGRYLVALDEDNAARMAALIIEYGQLPETNSCHTPRGRRSFYSVPEETPRERIKNISGIGGEAGVDLKAAGGQVVVFGRNAGGEYEGFDPTQPIAELPASWTLAILAAPKPPSDAHKYTPHTLREDGRAKRRFEKYLDQAVVSECRLLAKTKEGQRNSHALESAIRLFSLVNGMHLHTAWTHVRAELTRAVVAAGLSEKETRDVIGNAEKYVVDNGQVRMPRPAPDFAEGRAAHQPCTEPANDSFTDEEADARSVKLIEDNGSPAKIAENVARMLSIYPRGVPRLNMLKGKPEWPDGKEVTDSDELELQGWLVARPHAQRVRAGIDAVGGGIALAASRNMHEPVQAFLGGITWDGKSRLATFGPKYLETENAPIVREMFMCFFVGAVARAMVPGCQVDTMLILQGDQGIRKTTAFRVLAGEDWYSCAPIIIGKEPDCYQKLDGAWIYELGEVDGQLKNERRQEDLKGYITTRTDVFRRSYGRNVIVRPRRNVFVGTANSPEMLIDTTGSRRYHIVRCGRAHIDELGIDRVQLWAEAAHLYRSGVSWWLGDEMSGAAAQEAEKRFIADPWEERLPIVLRDKMVTTTAEMLLLLGVDPGRFDRAYATKIGIALRRVGGWIKVEGPVEPGGAERFHYRRS